MKKLFISTLLCATFITPALADERHKSTIHAPIGVMGDHMHKKGEVMFSYRFMQMDMDGNQSGTTNLSPEEIATTIPNRFFGVAGQPSTLRVVPLRMTTNMHMLGSMYGITDDLTLMAMVNYIDRDMDHVTFQGGAGTTRLGKFTTNSKGFGDTKVSGMYRLFDSTDSTHHVHANLGLSIPTGSITERDNVLAPNGMRPELRMPYAMQLGTGTYDLLPGLTYTGFDNQWSWGAQYNAAIPLESQNDEGYSWGDKHNVTAWTGYQWNDNISTSARVSAQTQSAIDGIDPNIVAPVQTANPDNYGGEKVNFSLGAMFTGTQGAFTGHEFSVEAALPVYQDLNGVQMESDFMMTAGWRKKF